MMTPIEMHKELAQEALNRTYGKGYLISDQDVEMMVEFMLLVIERKAKIRNEEMIEASEKRGIEW
jgi:hypothetical protein